MRFMTCQKPSSLCEPSRTICQTLEVFPTLTASRLYVMAYGRGYRGSPDHFRHLIACQRPRPKAEAYLRLRTLPGGEGQVDWGLCRARHSPHYAESGTMPSIVDTAAFSAQLKYLGRHILAPSSFGRRARMQPNDDRLWTLARDPEGPLVGYLDTFARWLNEQGFERHWLGRQVRAAAQFSHWLQSEHIAAEALTDEHPRRFLKERVHQGWVRQGAAATLRRLIDLLRRLGVCGVPSAISEPTPIEQIVAAYASYLRKEHGLSTRTLAQYCPFAESFLSERFGIGPVNLATLRGLDAIKFVQQQAARLSPARAKAATIALRSFLRYVRFCGETRFGSVTCQRKRLIHLLVCLLSRLPPGGQGA
jgi:hypothetical protein